MTQQLDEANDMLFGGSARTGRSLAFHAPGTSHTGTICGPLERVQKIDEKTGLGKTWPDGNPVYQVIIPLQTDQRSAAIEGDDGVRYLYVDGSKKPESRSKHAAVAAAGRAAGVSKFEPGGRLTITYVGDGPKRPNAGPMESAPKQYSATYVPPASADLLDAAVPQQPAAAGRAKPWA